MRRQRNKVQMKEQTKLQKTTKQNGDNLPDAEFKTLVIRVLKELSEDVNSIKYIQSEMKNTLSEIENNLQGNNS